jgi:hypothetical protein
MNQLTWGITGACDKIFYAPGEYCTLDIRVYNNSRKAYLKASNWLLDFDFGAIPTTNPEIVIPPNDTGLIRYSFPIPRNTWGKKLFTLRYRMHYFNGRQWRPIGNFSANDTHFVYVLPQRQINSSRYTVFVSRSIRNEDRPLGDFIAHRLQQWNLETRTVGIEVHAAHHDTARIIREEIGNADGVIAIATPRNFDQITGTWRTLEWLHGETGIAYGVNRPLLIMREGNVQLGALPQYLISFDNRPIIHFTSNNLSNLVYQIDSWMPYYRESVNKERVDRFFANLLKVGTGILAGIGLGVVLKNAFDGFGWTQKKYH